MIKHIIRNFGVIDYNDSWRQMQDFTDNRTANTPDEFWVLEHNPVYTLGLAGLDEHILTTATDIPVIRTDRGGQVTYHGPGQIIIYILVDLNRRQISIRNLVERLELGIINYLKSLNIQAYGDRDRPGVYVDNKKIASLGLKVRKGSTYHGISFNYNMDLTPFNRINVCGYSNLKVVQLADLIDLTSTDDVKSKLVTSVIQAVYSKE